MNRIFLVTIFFITSVLSYGQSQRTQMQLESFKESVSDGGMENLGVHFMKDWPKDIDGTTDCAWIRVTFENLSVDDARNVAFNFGPASHVVTKRDRLNENEKELWFFVSPSENAFMEASLKKYGTSNRLPDLRLEPKHVYDVVLKNDKTISINVITIPEAVTATLETDQQATTPATITDVALGRHTLTLSKNGEIIKQEEIFVTERNVRFEYDIRKKKNILFDSDPAGAFLYVDDQEMGKTPMSLELPYGMHNVEVVLGPLETDSLTFTIDDNTPEKIVLEPVKKRTFDVVAVYGGRRVDADLFVDGTIEGKKQSSYTLTKPMGQSYNIKMSYNGYSKERVIKVNQHMDVINTFKIPAHNAIVWPWQREYDKPHAGVSFGYVSKQLVTRGEGIKYKEDGAWHSEGKSMPGFQVGFHVQPCLPFGLGIYTGFFLEFYKLDSKDTDAEYDEFYENCFYIPLHAYYRIPFAKRVALSVHGGIGYNYVSHGSYSKEGDDDKESMSDYYAKDYHAKRYNLTADIGVRLRIWYFQVHAQYSKGLTKHEMYLDKGDFKTVQNKFSVGLSIIY